LHNPFDRPERIELLGGFSCLLTCDQENRWTEFARENPLYTEYQSLSIDLSVSRAQMENGSIEQADAYRKQRERLRDLDRELYDVSRTWYLENVASEIGASFGVNALPRTEGARR
jgi:hypothetical protein